MMKDLSPPPETENLAEWLRQLKRDEDLSEEEIGHLLEKHSIEPWQLVRTSIAAAVGPDEVWAALHSDGPEDSLSVISLHRTEEGAQSAVEESKAETRKWLQEVNAEAKRTHAELDYSEDYDPTQTWEEFTRHMAWDVQQLTIHE